MQYCKVCDCGLKIVFPTRTSFPEKCPGCGRFIRLFDTYREDDPQLERLLRQKETQNGCGQLTAPEMAIEQPAAQPEAEQQKAGKAKTYVLTAADGRYSIALPPEGGILGRDGIGARQLAHNEAVSREHLRVTIMRNALIIEDMSRYGTKLNGKTLVRGLPTRAELNDRITLYNETLVLLEKEEDKLDSD